MARDARSTGAPIMVRASITDREWKALRSAAIQTDSNVQTIVGQLISEYLWANGYIEREETQT